MLKIVLADTEAQYQQVRELLAEFMTTDLAQLSELGFDAQAALDFYFASGKQELPGL